MGDEKTAEQLAEKPEEKVVDFDEMGTDELDSVKFDEDGTIQEPDPVKKEDEKKPTELDEEAKKVDS